MNQQRRLLPMFASCLCALPLVAAAQTGVDESQQHLRDAAKARDAGDDEGAIRSYEKARALNPAGLYTKYNLARAYARRGQADRALDLLEDLARARVDFGIANEADFRALADTPRFRRLLAATAETATSQSVSRPLAEFGRVDLVPEGIAWDDARRRLFFGSMRSGEVFALQADGSSSKFAEVAHEGRLAAIGMTVDTTRGVLWVVGASSFLNEDYNATAATTSGLFGFDLDSGELRHKALRNDAGYGYNDVTLAPNGDVYVSGAELGKLSAGLDRIDVIATSEPVFGSNGIAVTADGGSLIASAYPSGIAVVRLADGATHFLRAPDDVTLYGIDGLYLHDGDLVAVQNGVKPWRLMRYALSPDLQTVTAALTLEIGTSAVATTGAIVVDGGGNAVIHYVAQGRAPATPPSHIPASLHEYLGRTVIMTAPLR